MPCFLFRQNMLELRSKPSSLTFLIRKVSKRISHRPHHFILVKLLKFQETFLEKFFVSGFGAEAPQLIMLTKKARHRHAFLKSFAVFAEKFLVIFFLVLFSCRTEMNCYSDSGYDYISHNVEYDGKNCGSGT